MGVLHFVYRSIIQLNRLVELSPVLLERKSMYGDSRSSFSSFDTIVNSGHIEVWNSLVRIMKIRKGYTPSPIENVVCELSAYSRVGKTLLFLLVGSCVSYTQRKREQLPPMIASSKAKILFYFASFFVQGATKAKSIAVT